MLYDLDRQQAFRMATRVMRVILDEVSRYLTCVLVAKTMCISLPQIYKECARLWILKVCTDIND